MTGLTERQVQRAVLRMRAHVFPGVYIAHVPNGAHLKGDAGPLLGDGMAPGFPDLIALWQGGMALIEVKREKGGRLSPAQIKTHADLADIGHPVAVVRSALEAQAVLLDRGAPAPGALWRAV